MVTKICIGGCIADIYPCAKFHYNSIMGFICLTYARLLAQCVPYLASFPQFYSQAAAAILTLNTSKGKDVPFRDPKRKFYIMSPFSQKIRNFRQFSARLKMSARMRLQHRRLHKYTSRIYDHVRL